MVQCDISDLSQTMETIEGRLALLLSVDSTFSIELSVCRALQGRQGEKLMEATILDKLPTADKPIKLATSVVALRSLKEAPLAKWTGEGSTNILAAVMEQLQKMSKGQAPNMEHFSSDFMKQVRKRLEWFCTHVPEKVGGQKPGPPLNGEKTASAKLKALEARLNKGTADLSSLDELHSFEWLLSVPERARLSELATKMVSAATKKVVKRTGKVVDKKKAAKAEKTEEESLADVFALFGGST